MILGYGIWQRRYGGDPKIVGKPIQLDDTVRTVVGVMPEGFRILLGDDTGVPPRVDVFIPQNFWQQRNVRWLRVIGRLAPGVTLVQAQSELDNIAQSLVAEYQEYATTGFALHAIPLHGDLVRDVRPAVLALLGAVGFVLLIACSNVANLSLARTKLREQEIALRLALGAGQGRILRQVLTENLLLALARRSLGPSGRTVGVGAPARLSSGEPTSHRGHWSKWNRIGFHNGGGSLDGFAIWNRPRGAGGTAQLRRDTQRGRAGHRSPGGSKPSTTTQCARCVAGSSVVGALGSAPV